MILIIGAPGFLCYHTIMIEIYKRLPKTNCGQCGVSTCMAFAQKVKKSQARLSGCPFMAAEATSGGQQPSQAPAFSTYEQVSQELEKEAAGVNFRETAEAVGGTYESVNGRESIVLKMIGTAYELRRDGLYRNNEYCNDAWAKIIICDYVRRQGRKPLTGEWIPLGLFPNAASLVKAFQNNAQKEIAASFKRDLVRLKQRCTELGGSETESQVKADYVCQFDLLPHLPLYLSFWASDDEFDADCKLLFDSSAEDHIDIGYLAYLVERFAAGLVAA